MRHTASFVLALAIGMSRSAAPQGVTLDGCVDALGRSVASVPNDYLQDVARASLAPNGLPVIEYNRGVLAGLSWQSNLFWYAHECGHHALGHALGREHPLRMEQAADCFGINAILDNGQIRRADVAVIQAEISRSPGDWLHLPGPFRAVNLARCRGGRGARTVRLPRYCCTQAGRLGPYPNPGPNGVTVGEGGFCQGFHPTYGMLPGQACH